MTDRLYYDQTYLREFDAQVLEVRTDELNRTLLRLDRSAFYPTSGGQPYDTGKINAANVTDVFVDGEGEVWHAVDAPFTAGESIHGVIDWARRFDHMQQHAGEHILAGAVHRLMNGHTIGLHLGAEASSIDVDFPDGRTHLTFEELCMLEDDVNDHIQRDVPIRCWFPTEKELNELPLRKPPTVRTHVRVVQIGDDEFCACGGTHPDTAGQIGLFKIIDARPSKGKLRLTFVCGKRAFEDYRKRSVACEKAALILSTGWESLADTVDTVSRHLKETEYQLNRERRERVLDGIEAVCRSAQTVNGVRVIAHAYGRIPADALREAATAMLKAGQTVVLLCAETDAGVNLLFARSGDVNIHIGKVLSESAKLFGGKGGGKPDFAQGAAQSPDVLSEAVKLVCAALNA